MSQTETFMNMTGNLSKQIMDNAQGRKMLGEQMERFWRTENNMVSELQDYLNGWCERRHDAAGAAMDFGHTLTNSADQSDVMEAWNTLSSKAMKRFSEDAEAQMLLFQNMAAMLTPGAFSFSAPTKSAEPAEAANDKKAAKPKNVAAE